MSDRLIIETGSRPWTPSSEADLIEVYHRYNVPLAGLISQSGHVFAFQCLIGHAEPVNLWGYALLEETDVKELDHAGDNVTELIGEIFTRRLSVVALHDEGVGVAFSVTPSTLPPAPPINNTRAGMEALTGLIEDVFEQYNRQRAAADRAVSNLKDEAEGLVPA